MYTMEDASGLGNFGISCWPPSSTIDASLFLRGYVGSLNASHFQEVAACGDGRVVYNTLHGVNRNTWIVL